MVQWHFEFQDMADAGRRLAETLTAQGLVRPVVYALALGGMPVAFGDLACFARSTGSRIYPKDWSARRSSTRMFGGQAALTRSTCTPATA